MVMTLQDAKDKFKFTMTNFCVMPTHIHLLIKPENETCLSKIMQWIKTNSAKRWNGIHGSIDHLWGHRYFARMIKDTQEYEFVMDYINQNPVVAGLSPTPEQWKASGAYYKVWNIPGLVDFTPNGCPNHTRFVPPIPPGVSKILPQVQLAHLSKYYGIYAEIIERLNSVVSIIPGIGDIENMSEPPVYLHYFTGTADYFICQYDGEDIMYGKVCFSLFPDETEYRKFSLTKLKNNQNIKLDFSWVPDTRP
jgi:REP element-mobilizing transposase RayT